MAYRYGRGADHPIRAPRYTTDMSDEEWQVIKPLMFWPAWLHGNGGRPENRRLIMDAIRYVDVTLFTKLSLH